ncbi:MAG: hypothetical protein KBC02_02625 [Candidatus Pacebacteria bacterium]|nr:hypothetical protein [Candidatus Paceibacterota bacterium]
MITPSIPHRREAALPVSANSGKEVISQRVSRIPHGGGDGNGFRFVLLADILNILLASKRIEIRHH